MSTAAKVSYRINRMQRGVPFSITRLYDLGSHTSVQKALSRLVQEGIVERVSKGIYARPKPLPSMPSIKTTASAEQVAKVWAKEHRYKLVSQGQEAAYRLGLQTQSPMRTIFWSNGPSRSFRVGNEVVEVRHTSEQKLRWEKSPKGTLLRGLLVTPPESVGISSLKKAFQRLSLPSSKAQQVARTLSNLPTLHAWQSKLQHMEQIA